MYADAEGLIFCPVILLCDSRFEHLHIVESSQKDARRRLVFQRSPFGTTTMIPRSEEHMWSSGFSSYFFHISISRIIKYHLFLLSIGLISSLFFWKSRSPVEDHHSGKSGRKTRQERKQVIDSTSGIHNAVFLSFSTERNKPKLNPASETPQPDNGPEEAEDTESDVDADMH